MSCQVEAEGGGDEFCIGRETFSGNLRPRIVLGVFQKWMGL
jgi:hypothetical protein